MRKGLIIFIVVVLAAGSLAGVVFYRKNNQKDSQLSDQLEQIEALKKKISKLGQDAAGFQQQSVANQKRIKSLEDEKQHVVQLEKVLKEKDKALEAVRKEYDGLREEFEKSGKIRKSLEKQVAKLQGTNQLLAEAEKEIQNIKSIKDDLVNELEKERKTGRTLKKQLAEAHDSILTEQVEFQNKQKELEAVRKEYDGLREEFEKSGKIRRSLEEQVAKLIDQQSKDQDKYSSLDKKLLYTNQLLAEAEKEIQNIKRIRNDLALKLEKERTEKHTFEKELAQAHDNITRDQIEFQNKQNELEAAQSQIVSLTGLVEQTKAELADLSNQLSILKPEKTKLEAGVSGLKTQIRDLSKVRLADQVAYQNRQRELEAAQSQIVNLREEAQKNQAVKAILEKEVSGFKAQLLDLKDTHQRIQTIQKEIQKTADINSLLKNQISILQLQLNNYQEKTLNYASTVEEKESQLKLIVSNLNSCLVNSKDVEASLQTAQSQIVNLMGMVEQARAEQVVMSKQLSNLESEKTEMALKITEVKKTYDTLIRELHDKIETKEAVIEDCEKKFSVTFIDRVLFYSGKASITTAGQGILKKTGDILSRMRFGVIRIAGHTDNVPIRRGWRGRFPTNWELSSARAVAVARFFQKESNISPENMEVVGFGSHRPVASNMTREGRAKNRRVEITIAPMGPKVRSTP